MIRGVCIAPIPNKGSRYRHSYFRSILASKFFMTHFFCHMACCRLANWTHIWLKWIVDMACKSSHEIYIAPFSRPNYKLALWRNGSMLSSRPAGRVQLPRMELFLNSEFESISISFTPQDFQLKQTVTDFPIRHSKTVTDWKIRHSLVL